MAKFVVIPDILMTCSQIVVIPVRLMAYSQIVVIPARLMAHNQFEEQFLDFTANNLKSLIYSTPLFANLWNYDFILLFLR